MSHEMVCPMDKVAFLLVAQMFQQSQSREARRVSIEKDKVILVLEFLIQTSLELPLYVTIGSQRFVHVLAP
jgi:hypothetical protein